jgi:mannose-6-phosphate isomerase-like protein (cupin superfamily)
MRGYFGPIEDLTVSNTNFRQVLYTGPKMQLVLMSLLPGEDIGEEVHDDHDQFFRFEEGVGKVVVGDDEWEVGDGDAVVVPAGLRHNVINTADDQALKFYTLYAPAEHADGVVHKTKAEAVAAEH